MTIVRYMFALILLVAIAPTALSGPCGKDGMTVLRADDGSGFLFFVFREKPDLYFEVPGKQISFPNGLEGPRRFLVDGTLFESLLVKPTEFMKLEKDPRDLDILKQHQAYEFAFIQKTASPLKKLVELGPRMKKAANGQPDFTFYLWQASDPADLKGTRQYFLTTVTAGEVVVLTAIVRDDVADGNAMQVFQSYASSFQHVLKKEQCPETKSK
jgi:hypothetical protein